LERIKVAHFSGTEVSTGLKCELHPAKSGRHDRRETWMVL